MLNLVFGPKYQIDDVIPCFNNIYWPNQTFFIRDTWNKIETLDKKTFNSLCKDKCKFSRRLLNKMISECSGEKVIYIFPWIYENRKEITVLVETRDGLIYTDFWQEVPKYVNITWERICRDLPASDGLNYLVRTEGNNKKYYSAFEFCELYIKRLQESRKLTAFLRPFIKTKKSKLIDAITQKSNYDINIIRIIARFVRTT